MSVPARAYLSIGEVLTKLRGDFPDITISKIRFLESEGLIDPQRTPSGYRKFTGTDLERLRYVLLAQRDQYLPLRVIKENLDALDRGLEPAPSGGVAAPRPSLARIDGDIAPSAFGDSSEMRLSREELLKASGLTENALVELESFGLITPRGRHYDGDALAVGKAVTEMNSFGIEPRHLRSFKSAADREIGLIEQVITPLTRQKSAESKARAQEVQKEIASLSIRLHASLVRGGLNRLR
ncbi:MAG: MerR family DNA-binding transcriptional regulator [Actinobacteria bacterium]|jgi:DNA-binding transcriptional MerR regulator|nr:MerR family DNA-binding transcriptional regulator [Actinomycetota bacterium]NDH81100.1 MerR family DNA-binding transcriptional regulator [Actinomycetota bacterium]NDH99415.1 MerR family DNA-binding transcriptional regulator [Actinomycetota bacterium]